ncbi:hypothetical protein Adt_21205 [Abeliophyllum distichum]|uniref:Uncharacterized protein n=1 Tax=Abeliophyllum distichum TaxID=126358 RepID=A0ABD1SYP1_9LAMI
MAKAGSSRGSVAASEAGSDPDPNFEDDNEDDCLGVDSHVQVVLSQVQHLNLSNKFSKLGKAWEYPETSEALVSLGWCPVREASNSRLKEITELSDGSVQVQFSSSSSSSRYSFTSSRPESFQTFKQAEKQPSEKFKGVDFIHNIAKTHYSEEEDDSTRQGSESPTLSDMRSQRDQLNVISSTIDRKREFKKSKDPQIRSFRKNLKRLLSKEEMNRFWEEFYSYPEDISLFEWAYLKTFRQKPTINTFQDNSKIWTTTSGNNFQSVHPPLEEIVIPKGDVKVIAFPLKQISDKGESDNPTIKDIKNI